MIHAEWMFELEQRMTLKQLRVWNVLLHHANNATGMANPSVETFTRLTGMDSRDVRRSLKSIAEDFASMFKAVTHHAGRPTVWVVRKDNPGVIHPGVEEQYPGVICQDGGGDSHKDPGVICPPTPGRFAQKPRGESPLLIGEQEKQEEVQQEVQQELPSGFAGADPVETQPTPPHVETQPEAKHQEHHAPITPPAQPDPAPMPKRGATLSLFPQSLDGTVPPPVARPPRKVERIGGPSNADRLHALWQEVTGNHSAPLDKPYAQGWNMLVTAAGNLETAEDAIRGMALDDWHMGRDPRSPGRKTSPHQIRSKVHDLASVGRSQRLQIDANAASKRRVALGAEFEAVIASTREAIDQATRRPPTPRETSRFDSALPPNAVVELHGVKGPLWDGDMSRLRFEAEADIAVRVACVVLGGKYPGDPDVAEICKKNLAVSRMAFRDTYAVALSVLKSQAGIEFYPTKHIKTAVA